MVIIIQKNCFFLNLEKNKKLLLKMGKIMGVTQNGISIWTTSIE
jgi:hypothetical protein